MLLILCAVFALSFAQNSPVVGGTAELRIDLTGFSSDVQVSIDNTHVYTQQGGEVRRYTVPTTNELRTYQVIITEGSAAKVVRNVQLVNDGAVTLTGFRATLVIHMEDFSVPAGNDWAVKLRVRIGGADNVFREYSNIVGAPYRVPLSALGSVPSSTAFEVVVLAVDTPVSVWAGEYHNDRLAVSVVGHNGNGLVWDGVCSDFRCDSGRLVARASVPLLCAGQVDHNLPTIDRLYLLSNPSPTVSPVEVVREWTNVAPASMTWWVLAVDNYQVKAEEGEVTKVVALNCAIGECEANPLTSVLTVWTNVLRGSIRLTVNVNGQWKSFGPTYQIVDADRTRICVLNLPQYRVSATISTGGSVIQDPINCGNTNQVCKTYIYAIVNPQYVCLPESGVAVATTVTQGSVSVYQRWGPVTPTLVVPALNNLELNYYDGQTQWTPPGAHPVQVNGQVSSSSPLSDCRATIDTTTRNQDGNAPGACGPSMRADRMLSIFDLAFLPAVEAGFLPNGQLPPNGEASNVTVSLTNTNGQVFRFLRNQGGEPRMYCVLGVELKSKIEESCSCYNSPTIDCVQKASEGADCSVCDFLSILEYDLRGLPREVNSIIYGGPRDGAPVTIIDSNFNSYSIPTGRDCEKVETVPNWENRYPPNANVELWSEGCNGAPSTLPNGAGTGNTLKIGNMEPYYAGIPEPLPFVNSTCVKFTVPTGVSQVNVAFYAWQHGNGNHDTNAFVRATGINSGVSLKAWIQVTPNAWTLNSVRLLNVLPGEEAEVCFVQDGQYGTQIDNVKIDAQQYALCPIRWMYWQGNYLNQIPVLRSGSGDGCPEGVYGRYCIRVFDGAAYKEECVTCDDKICRPFRPFVCNMCLDLASPNDSPGLENSIMVSIERGGSVVRKVVGQGGSNGCILKKREISEAQRKFAELEREKEEAYGLDSRALQTMKLAEVEKIRREVMAEVTAEYKKRAARSGPYDQPGQTQSVYPVLCLNYRVCLSESCVDPVCFDVDCTENGSCSYQDAVALATIPFDCPTLPGNLGLTLYNAGAQFNQNGDLQSGCQVRGRTASMLLNTTTCQWSQAKFVGPSYEDVGHGSFTFPVLRTTYKVRIDENTLGHTYGQPGSQPDPLQHPWSATLVDCVGKEECSIPTGRLVSEWYIRSERGRPRAPDNRLGIRFGVNSQNLIRSIPDFDLQVPDWNKICVVADERPWYTALWETWSSRGPTLPFDDCSSTSDAIDRCRNDVVVPPRSR